MVPLMAPIVITISNDCLCVPLSYLIHWYVVIQWSVTNYIWTVMYHHGLWLKRKKKKVWPAHQADCNGSEFHSRSCILDRLTGPNGASGRGCVCFHRRRRSKRVPDVLSMPIPDNSPWLVVPWRMTPFSMHATGRTSLSLFIFTYLFLIFIQWPWYYILPSGMAWYSRMRPWVCSHLLGIICLLFCLHTYQQRKKKLPFCWLVNSI